MACRIAVLISGTGSNLRAISEAIDAGSCNAEICVVISDKLKAKGLEFARGRGLNTEVVRLKNHADRDAWNSALTEALNKHRPQLVVLAGFMKIVGQSVIDAFRGRIINIHPSLLPLFVGTTGPQQALDAGVRVSGCTVHVVDGGTDTGPIIGQAAVAVLAGDDADTLHERIKAAEHRLLPAIIDAVASGRIALRPELRLPDAQSSNAMLFSPALDDVS